MATAGASASGSGPDPDPGGHPASGQPWGPGGGWGGAGAGGTPAPAAGLGQVRLDLETGAGPGQAGEEAALGAMAHMAHRITERQQQVFSTVVRARQRALELEHASAAKARGRGGLVALVKRALRLPEGPQRGGGFVLWRRKLREIEGRFGTNAATSFGLLKTLLVLDAMLFLLWFVGVVYPFLAAPPPSFSWAIFRREKEVDLLRVEGLGATFFLYGGYSYACPAGACSGYGSGYRMDLAFPAYTFITFLGSLFYLARHFGRLVPGGVTRLRKGKQQYATAVLAGWDWRLTSIDASRKLRKGLRVQLEDLGAGLAAAALKKPLAHPPRLVGLLLLWPGVLVGCCACARFVTLREDEIFKAFGAFSYIQALIITSIILFGRLLTDKIIAWEQWPATVVIEVRILKLFLLRFLVLATFMYGLYDRAELLAPEGVCAGNLIGTKVYLLLAAHVFFNVSLQVAKTLVGKYSGNNQAFDFVDTVTDAMYQQCIVWLGTIHAPMLPLFGALSFFLAFHAKHYCAYKYNISTVLILSPSRYGAYVCGMLMAALLLCSFPISHVLAQQQNCGPHAGTSIARTLGDWMGSAPPALDKFVSWVMNPLTLLMVAVAVLVLLLRVKKTKRKLEKGADFLAVENQGVRLASRAEEQAGGA